MALDRDSFFRLHLPGRLILSALNISSLPTECILDPYSLVLHEIFEPVFSNSQAIDLMSLAFELLDIKSASGGKRIIA